MYILEIDDGCTHFRVLDGDKVIVESYFNRMNRCNGFYTFYIDEYMYEIPVDKVILKRKLVRK